MEQTRSTRVLVTGGTGFVGSHLVELLLEKGYSVTCLVRNKSRLRWLSGVKVDLAQGDCSDPGSLVSAVRDASIVIHCAGLTKAKHARDYYLVNHLGTKNILDACARYNSGVKKFVLISSLAAAGPSPDGVPVRDADQPRPISDYGRSKLRAEEEALRYKDRFPILILRPSAVYGPRDQDMFELFRWASWGVTLEICGGERYINPCYVSDLAAGIAKAIERETPGGSIYFLAENKSYSWSDFKKALLTAGEVKAITLKIPYAAAYLIGLVSELGSFFTRKPALTNRQKVLEASQRYWLCDLTRTEQELGFKHTYPLQTGLQITWQWYRDNNWLR